jgi:hypothetical protein
MTKEELKQREDALEAKKKQLDAQETMLRSVVESNNYTVDLELSRLSRIGDKQRARAFNIGMIAHSLYEISIRHTDGTNYWVPLGFEEMEILIEQLDIILRLNNYQRKKGG